MNYIYHPSSWLFLPLNMSIVVCTFSYMQLTYIRAFYYGMSRVVREYLLLHPAYRSVRGFPLEQPACHTRVANINTRVHLPLTLKIINRDYLRFAKPLTITILTVSTSSTLETALFH